MVFYICNQADPNCVSRAKYGQCLECKHTTKPNFAKNGVCNDPEKHPERFEPETFEIANGRSVTYYWEKEQTSNDI